VEIVPYQPEHFSELLSFLREQFRASPQKGDASFFNWRFTGNPLGPSLENYHLAIEGNRIVGQLGAIRDRIWAMDRWWDCCWLVDLIVAKQHRGAGSTACPRLFREVMKKCPLLLVTGAGPKLFRFYKAMGWNYRNIASTYFSVRRPGPLLAVAKETGESHTPLESLLPIAGWAMMALHACHPSPKHRFEFTLLHRFGDEVDRLAERVIPSLKVTSYRSANYLNWKFNQRPQGTHFVITARHNGGSDIQGYAAVKIMDRRPHARWAEVVDFLLEPGDSNVFAALMHQIAERTRQWDVDFLRLRCSLPEHGARLRAPFWIRRNRPVIDGTFFRAEDAQLARYLTEEPWHLTSLVSDRTDHGADEFIAQPRPASVAQRVWLPHM